MYQVIGNQLHTCELENHVLGDFTPFDGIIADVAFALQATI